MKDLDEDEFNAFLDDVEKKIFMSEEEAEVWMEEEYMKVANKRQYPTRHPKLKLNEDTLEQFFAEPEQPVESLLTDEWILTEEHYHRWLTRQNERIGRYPEGFRHFESLTNYRLSNHGATMDDYVDALYAEVTFEDFLKVMRMAAIESLKDPENRNDLFNAPGWSGFLPE